MIGLISGIVFSVLFILCLIISLVRESADIYAIAALFFVLAICGFVLIYFTGVVNYAETTDIDKARITAVDTIQTPFRIYYKVDVEYLTNTPYQQGIITQVQIEKDTYYTYDKNLAMELRANMYKEMIIISGYKGGFETWKDFNDKLIKGYELIKE